MRDESFLLGLSGSTVLCYTKSSPVTLTGSVPGVKGGAHTWNTGAGANTGVR